MVDREKQRSRYLAGSEGAPPVPPPGGYHGARRVAPPPFDPTAGFPAIAPTSQTVLPPQPGSPQIPAPQKERKPANAIGWIALVGAILFAIVLLATMLAGGTDILYGVTMLTLQLVVGGVVIAALCTARGRRLGASALIVALLLNVATVGALGAIQTSASGAYEGQKSDEQLHQEAYPGVKDVSESTILAQPSLESVRSQSDEVLSAIRDRLTSEFGFTWTQGAAENLRPVRNGYGGESMLSDFTSQVWATNEPVQGYDHKLEVMNAIEDVLYDYGMWGMTSFNDPATAGLDDAMLTKLYGSADPETQTAWEWYSDNYPDLLRFYADIYDLSNDTTGDFRTEREADSARTGEPLEGLQLFIVAPQLLSEQDVDEFQSRMSEY